MCDYLATHPNVTMKSRYIGIRYDLEYPQLCAYNYKQNTHNRGPFVELLVGGRYINGREAGWLCMGWWRRKGRQLGRVWDGAMERPDEG